MGFKYIAEVISKEPILIAGEESGGLDGPWARPGERRYIGLPLDGRSGSPGRKTFSAILKGIYQQYGGYYSDRMNLKLKDGFKEVMTAKLKDYPPVEIAGQKVVDIVRKDGTKFILANGEWIMLRFSGTEPLMRCYMEAHTPENLEKLKRAGKEFTQL